jgi:hypothetical protein
MNGARHNQSRRLLLLLLALCGCLLGVIYLEAAGSALPAPPEIAPRAPAASDAAGAGNARFALPPLNTYAEVTQRPLFAETRRPAPGSAVDPAAASFTLVAIIISGDDRHALLAHGQPPQTERIVEGQSVDGWTVESILSDRVVLRRVDTRMEVTAKSKATLAPASPAPAASVRPLPNGMVRAAPQFPPPVLNRAPGVPPPASGGH